MMSVRKDGVSEKLKKLKHKVAPFLLAVSTSLTILDSRDAISLPLFPLLPAQGLIMVVLKGYRCGGGCCESRQ